jgi:predicted lipid-binding transport protein (Tim44 family)
MSAFYIFGSIGLAVAIVFLCLPGWRRRTNVPEALSTSVTGALLGGLMPGLILQLDLDEAVFGLSCITSALGATLLTLFTLSRPQRIFDATAQERHRYDS